MATDRREQIAAALRRLAENHAATMRLLELTTHLLSEELALEGVPTSALRAAAIAETDRQPIVDHAMLSVHFRGRSCFLGNTLPFRLFAYLAQHPRAYLNYESLLNDVWTGIRSESAVRTVVKRLREKLRRAGMPDLANAIDGSIPGHYSLAAVD